MRCSHNNQHDAWMYCILWIYIFTVLPRLNSVVELASSSQTALEIRFATWSPNNGGGHPPAGYVVRGRTENSSAWIDGPNIGHPADGVNHTARLDNLEPNSTYYVTIVPFIVDGDLTFLGHPSEEGGPFGTLHIGIYASVQQAIKCIMLIKRIHGFFKWIVEYNGYG